MRFFIFCMSEQTACNEGQSDLKGEFDHGRKAAWWIDSISMTLRVRSLRPP